MSTKEALRKEAYLWCAEAIMRRCQTEAQLHDKGSLVMEIYRALRAAGQTPLTMDTQIKNGAKS